jgi:hypothetical protein
MPRIELYLPENAERTWKEFVKICKRERDTASAKIRDFMAKYVDAHKHGNPQMLLEAYGIQLTKPKVPTYRVEYLCPLCRVPHDVDVPCPRAEERLEKARSMPERSSVF